MDTRVVASFEHVDAQGRTQCNCMALMIAWSSASRLPSDPRSRRLFCWRKRNFRWETAGSCLLARSITDDVGESLDFHVANLVKWHARMAAWRTSVARTVPSEARDRERAGRHLERKGANQGTIEHYPSTSSFDQSRRNDESQTP
jgi:hypothetical protein